MAEAQLNKAFRAVAGLAAPGVEVIGPGPVWRLPRPAAHRKSWPRRPAVRSRSAAPSPQAERDRTAPAYPGRHAGRQPPSPETVRHALQQSGNHQSHPPAPARAASSATLGQSRTAGRPHPGRRGDGRDGLALAAARPSLLATLTGPAGNVYSVSFSTGWPDHRRGRRRQHRPAVGYRRGGGRRGLRYRRPAADRGPSGRPTCPGGRGHPARAGGQGPGARGSSPRARSASSRSNRDPGSASAGANSPWTWRIRYRTVCGCTCSSAAASRALPACRSQASRVSARMSCSAGRSPASGASRSALSTWASSGSGRDHQGGQVPVAADQPGAGRLAPPAAGQREHLPRPAQRVARPADRHGRAPGRRSSRAGPARPRPRGRGRLGSGTSRRGPGAAVSDQDVGRQRGQRGEVAGAPVFQGDHGDPAGQRPARRARLVGDRLPGHRRVGDDEVERPPPPALQLARDLGTGPREPLGARGRQFVQVEEERLADWPDRRDGPAARRGLLAQRVPGDPGAQPQRRLQRFQAAALSRLDPADAGEQFRRAVQRGVAGSAIWRTNWCTAWRTARRTVAV